MALAEINIPGQVTSICFGRKWGEVIAGLLKGPVLTVFSTQHVSSSSDQDVSWWMLVQVSHRILHCFVYLHLMQHYYKGRARNGIKVKCSSFDSE